MIHEDLIHALTDALTRVDADAKAHGTGYLAMHVKPGGGPDDLIYEIEVLDPQAVHIQRSPFPATAPEIEDARFRSAKPNSDRRKS